MIDFFITAAQVILFFGLGFVTGTFVIMIMVAIFKGSRR